MTGGRKALLIGGIALGFLLAAGAAAFWFLHDRPIGPHMAVVYRLDARDWDGPDLPETFVKLARGSCGDLDLRFVPVGIDCIEVRVPTEANVPKVSLEQIDAIMRSFGGGLEMRIAPTVRGTESSTGSGMEISQDEAIRCIALLGTATETLPSGSGAFRWFPLYAGQWDVSLASLLETTDKNGRIIFLLCEDPNFTWIPPRSKKWVSRAFPMMDETNRPALGFELTAEGAKRFSALTGANIGSHLAILVNGEVLSAPKIMGRISDYGTITRTFTVRQVKDLADAIGRSDTPVKVLLPAVSVSYRDK